MYHQNMAKEGISVEEEYVEEEYEPDDISEVKKAGRPSETTVESRLKKETAISLT